MIEAIDDVKGFIRGYLRVHAKEVPAKTSKSRKEHLEVWLVGGMRRAAGLEMDHAGRVNIWVTRMAMPPALPASVEIAYKVPKGPKWTDENDQGANSNLSSYDGFYGRSIARLGVTSIADARVILGHLNR